MKNKYNILLVIRWPVGGIRTFIRYVYRCFDSSKYKFTILAPDLKELRILLNDLKDFEVIYVPVDRIPSLNFFKEIISIKNEYDLVHSHGLIAGISSALPSLLSKSPHLLTIHEAITKEHFLGWKANLLKHIISFLLPYIDTIHSVTYDSQYNLMEYFPVLTNYKNKLVVIQHGIEIERFFNSKKRGLRNELNLPEKSFLIGFLGRFMPEKGFEYLIDAMQILLKEYKLTKEPYVLSFGEGSFIREEKEYVRRKGLEKRFIFMPFVPDVAPSLKGLDVIVMPSLWEACGLVAIESMVSGVPVIGSNCVGLREVLKSTPANIIPVRNSAALAKALIGEMNNPSKEKALKFKKIAAFRFDVRNQSMDLEKVILRMMNC